MPDVYEQLNLTNGIGLMICGRCNFSWEPRIAKEDIVKCPACQSRFHRIREQWPPGYEEVRFRKPSGVPRAWPQVDDPDPEFDIEWWREQSVLEYRAKQRMKASA